MNGGRKNFDSLLSLERIEENCGCRGRNADWREWVFPGEGKGAEKPFRMAYRDLVRVRGETSPEDPHPGLFFRRGVETPVRTGDDSERAFFSSFGFLVDFFAQPDNAQELGKVLRQFMSRYCGEGVLEGLPKADRGELTKAENALMKSCGDGHAHVTDTLRLLYNGAMAMLLGSGAGAKVGAVHLGDGGRKLTPIGTPEALAGALNREDRGGGGMVFCVDARTGRCYERGGWTAGEWTEAMARVEAESLGSGAAMMAGRRALDSYYFPEKVTSAVALRHNLLAELKDDALVHCRQGTTFSSVRLAARLGGVAEPGSGEERAGGGGRGGRGAVAGLLSNLEPEYGGEEDGRYLPAPSSFEEMMPDEAGLEALETAEARGGAKKVEGGDSHSKDGDAREGEVPKAAVRGRGGREETPEEKAGRLTRKFFRERPESVGGGEEDKDRLNEIFRHGDLSPSDYDPSQGCFVAGVGRDPGGDPSAWRKQSGEAKGREEAERLAKSVLRKSSSKTAGVAVAGGDGVFLVRRGQDGLSVSKVDGSAFDLAAGVSRGKITYEGCSYIAVGEVRRVPFGVAVPSGGEEAAKVRPLGKGGGQGSGISGIFGALKRALSGGR